MLPLLLTTLQFGSGPTAFPVSNEAEQSYHITVSLLHGDPLGSVEDMSIKVLARPELKARLGQFAQFEIRNVTFLGTNEKKSIAVSATPSLSETGRTRLRLQITVSQPNTDSLSGKAKAKIEGYETIVEFPDDKPKRFRLTAKEPHDQFWAEVSVKTINPPAPMEVKNLFEFKMGGVFGK